MEPSFLQTLRMILTWVGILLVISSMAWFLLPAYQSFIGGFMLGTTFSMLSGVILAMKTVHASEYAIGKRKKVRSTGMLQRFLLAILAIYIGIKFPAYFQPAGIILGLTAVTLISFLYAVWRYFKEDNTTVERGEN
jgi:hypothetical protein